MKSDSAKLPKLKHQEDNLNRSITNEIKTVMRSLPTKKIPDTGEFTAESYQVFKEDL